MTITLNKGKVKSEVTNNDQLILVSKSTVHAYTKLFKLTNGHIRNGCSYLLF